MKVAPKALKISLSRWERAGVRDHSQTVRLPAGFELAGNEVWVKDEATGEIILSPKSPASNRHGLQAFFKLLEEAPLPEDFLADRPNAVAVPRNPLEEWLE